MKIHLVVGARPNFMKLMPVYNNIKRECPDWETTVVHTGQHYDYEMSRVFFEVLNLPEPDVFLDVRSGTHGEQTARALERLERLFIKENPDLVMVFGDVNSTIAASLAAVKLGIKIAHVEAGLRSFDWSMPEEINRMLTDRISHLLFVTEKAGIENLKREGVEKDRIYFVGNTMIDTLITILPHADISVLNEFGLKENNYILVTLHRPSNVDRKEPLKKILGILDQLSAYLPVVFPIHPRTEKRIKEFNIETGGITIIQPQNYRKFLALERFSKLVITDSGGIQEETTYLRKPCITVRPNTERPVTEEMGTNVVLRDKPIEHLLELSIKAINGEWKKGEIPPTTVGWEGRKKNNRIPEKNGSYLQID